MAEDTPAAKTAEAAAGGNEKPVRLPQASVLRAANKRKADLSIIVGLLLAIGLIVSALFMGGTPQAFLDARALMIVLFGTLAVTAVSFNGEDFKTGFGVVGRAVHRYEINLEMLSKQLLELALIARAKGFLEMKKHEAPLRPNAFLMLGTQMLRDGHTGEEIARHLGREIDAQTNMYHKTAAILRRAAEVAPAMGLIGTLIGLVQMLAMLDDPASIGPSMAVALLTTFYGAFLSTVVFAPLAAKLEHNAQGEATEKRLIINALMSMARKENPRRLEMVLNSILPPRNRIRYFD
ncbi:MAG: biopolymer transporter ExbB [Micavibrio sp.]|nr:MAG: biopolymer transporter ExbB [Micavibrio sp.]